MDSVGDWLVAIVGAFTLIVLFDAFVGPVWERRRIQRRCFHHARAGGNVTDLERSWIRDEGFIDAGVSKSLRCTQCGKVWIV